MMNDTIMKRIAMLVFLCVSSIACAMAGAENLADPTRPPAMLERAQEQDVAKAEAPVLQSVLIGPGRAEAIISGQSVKVGDKFGEARVVRIAASEVLLRSGRDTQTLRLFPAIEKRVTRSPSYSPSYSPSDSARGVPRGRITMKSNQTVQE